MGVEKFRQILARVDKGGQVWMGQTDRAGMSDMGSGLVWVYLQVWGGCGQVWADMSKGGQKWAGLGWSE